MRHDTLTELRILDSSEFDTTLEQDLTASVNLAAVGVRIASEAVSTTDKAAFFCDQMDPSTPIVEKMNKIYISCAAIGYVSSPSDWHKTRTSIYIPPFTDAEFVVPIVHVGQVVPAHVDCTYVST